MKSVSVLLPQSWVYERFPELRPTGSEDSCHVPLALRWAERGRTNPLHNNYDFIRDYLNEYNGADVSILDLYVFHEMWYIFVY